MSWRRRRSRRRSLARLSTRSAPFQTDGDARNDLETQLPRAARRGARRFERSRQIARQIGELDAELGHDHARAEVAHLDVHPPHELERHQNASSPTGGSSGFHTCSAAPMLAAPPLISEKGKADSSVAGASERVDTRR